MDTLKFVDGVGAVYDDITDGFDRTVSDGWGSTDTGQAWTVEGTASAYQVGSSSGLHVHSTAGNTRRSTVEVGNDDMRPLVSFSFPDSTAATQPMDVTIAARVTDASNHYKARVELTTSGTLQLQLHRRVSGVDTQMGSTVTVGASYTADTLWRVRLEVVGPLIRCRAWLASGAEPTTWHITAYSRHLTTGTKASVFSTVTSGNTDVPLTISFGAFEVKSPVQVRLDLNDGTTWGLRHDGTDFSPPPLRRAAVASMLRDGVRQTATAYEDRVVRLTLDLLGSTVEASAERLQELAREVDRPENWLMWRRGTTHPVFFHVKRSPMGQVQEFPASATLRRVDVQLLADPFAYGVREYLSTATVAGDPPDIYFDVSDVKGDVQAPLRLVLGSALPSGYEPAMFATRRGGDPANVPHSSLPATWTLGTDASISTGRLSISFATNTTLTPARATWSAASYPSTDLRGRYRPFVYIDINTTGTFTIDLKVDGISVQNTTRTYNTDGLVQLEDIYLPPGLSARPGDVVKPPSLTLHVGRSSGTSSLFVHYVLLVPVDDQAAVVSTFTVPSNSGVHVWDDDGEWWAHAAGIAVSESGVLRGGVSQLFVSPGVKNRVYFLANLESGPHTPAAVTFDPSYLPRYLYVRPAAES